MAVSGPFQPGSNADSHLHELSFFGFQRSGSIDGFPERRICRSHLWELCHERIESAGYLLHLSLHSVEVLEWIVSPAELLESCASGENPRTICQLPSGF